MAKNKIIRSINELPEWYNLEKYEDISFLNAASWYDLLLQRHSHFFWLEVKGAKNYKGKTDTGEENPFYAALLQSRKKPLSLLTDDIQIALIGGGQLEALKYAPDSFATHCYAIQPLTIRRLYQNEQRLKDTTRLRIRNWVDQVFSDNFPPESTEEYKAECKWALSFIDEPIFETFETHGKDRTYYSTERSYDLVGIDLSVPDKILIQQFKDYLRYNRQKYPNIKKASRYKYPEYTKWIDYAVLPYLDLNLWAKEVGYSIPNRVMADAIFPNGEKGEEMVRKTTKKIADMLIDREYIEFLATIVAHEVAEKN